LKHDKPELEVRRGDLLREEEKMRSELDKLQENLLVELSSAQGDLLQNKVWGAKIYFLINSNSFQMIGTIELAE